MTRPFPSPLWRTAAAIAVALTLLGCVGGRPEASPPGPASAMVTGDPATDKLAQVQGRGTLVLSTDIAYPPQSFAVEGAARASDTACAANQLTGPEVDGYDVEIGKHVAASLGVEPCFVTPSWTEITGGNWADRWDVAWGSGAINADRMTRLYMTQPYYSDMQRFYVREDSDVQAPADLDGRQVGACAGCSHELYLLGTLEVPGVEIEYKVADPRIVTYELEVPGLAEVADGTIDAFLCAETVGAQAIADGLPLRALDEGAFRLYSTGFVDRSSGFAIGPFLARVNDIVDGLHADGTLRAASLEYFGLDLATAAAAFDLGSIGQTVP